MTSPRAHMRMCNTLFCLNAKLLALFAIAFYINLLEWLFITYRQKPDNLLLKTAGLLLHKTFFVLYSSVTTL